LTTDNRLLTSCLMKRLPRIRRGVDDPDNHRVGGEGLCLLGHASGWTLHDGHELALPAADRSDHDHRPRRALQRSGWVRRLIVLDVQGLDDEQLLAVQHLVLLRRDDVADYTCEKHLSCAPET